MVGSRLGPGSTAVAVSRRGPPSPELCVGLGEVKSARRRHSYAASRHGCWPMNPYVTARFGRYTKGDGLRRTPAVAGDGAAARRDVSFESLGNRRTLLVPRMPNDGGLCYVDVWHDTGGSAGQHIGSAVIAAPPDGEFRERVLSLWDDGGERGGNSMGTLRVRMRMHDKDGGRLGLQFVEANGLVTQRHLTPLFLGRLRPLCAFSAVLSRFPASWRQDGAFPF